MTLKQCSNAIALIFLIGVPIIFALETATQQVLQHPLGLFLLTPLCILIANFVYDGAKLPKTLLVLEGTFFMLWGVVCLSLFATSVSTENGLGTLLGSFFNAIGMPYPEAERMGMYLFVLLFLFSVCLAATCLLYAIVSRAHKEK